MCRIFATSSTVHASRVGITPLLPGAWVVAGPCASHCGWLSTSSSRGAFTRYTMQTRVDGRRRQSRNVVGYGTPPTAADLGYLAQAGELAQPKVDPRAAHAGRVHQLGTVVPSSAASDSAAQRRPSGEVPASWGVTVVTSVGAVIRSEE